MRITFKKKDGRFVAGLRRGKGGVSSLIAERTGSLWFCIQVFSIKNIYRSIVW